MNRQRIPLLLVFPVFFSMGALSGPARAMHCDGALISVGDTREKVREACGEPTEVRRPRDALINRGGIIVRLNVDEEWVYDFGSDRFVRTVRFRSGKVVDIEMGDYGGKKEDGW
jgi:hypothetical protein